MKIEWEEHRSGTVMRVTGELVADATDALRRESTERLTTSPRLVLDLRALERVDSAGLEALLWLSEEVMRRGGQFRIVRGGGQPAAAMQATRIDRRMAMHATLESAARSLSRGHHSAREAAA
ncbi:MAG: STAS domain-containing protein [Phycisphaerales bacterium]|nr:STAS domain-containing protein [Phycisphaerales bacterium]